MYRRKIVWLGMLCLLPVSMPALASDTRILVNRAHYWHKLGRTELEIKAWREVLSAEPDNAEAKAGLAKALELDKTAAVDPIADWLAEPGAAPHAASEPPHAASEPPHETTPATESAVADKAATVNETAVKAEPAVKTVPVIEPASAPAVATAPVVETAVKTEPEVKSAQVPTTLPATAPATVVTPVPVVESAALPAANVHSVVGPVTLVKPDTEATPTAKPISEAADAVASQVKPVVAKPLAVPDASRSGVDLGALQEELKSAQTERLSESRLLGLKKAQPDAVVQGGSLTPGNTQSSQALLERAAYWDRHGRRDLAKKLRQQAKADSTDEPVAAADTAPVQSAAASETSNGAIEAAQVNPTTSPESPPAPAETLAQVAKPTRQELTERAKYWEVRGRNDLAEKLHIQAAKAEPAPVEVVAVPAPVALPTAAAATPSQPATVNAAAPPPSSVAAQPASAAPTQTVPDNRNAGSSPQGGPTLGSELAAHPSTQEIADKAQYWVEHGRPDLAQQLKQTAKAVTPEKAPEKAPQVVIAKAQGETGTGTLGSELAIPPSRQDIADKAQYWAQHGRNDLAEQLKKKLQQMQPDRRLGSAMPDAGVAGDHDAKRSALEDYLLKNPNSLKARLDLAQIYRSIGEYAKAREQIDSVLTLSPDLPDALFASAQLYADQRLWWETLQTLEKISPVARTPEMGRLQKIGWAHVQIDRADAMVRQGDNRGAELLLRQVAAELVVNYNETALPEPPPLWKSGAPGSKKPGRSRSR